ncbi:FAD-binding oxidoreductase [Undibacterium terreum]|uniref:4-cresol dehydrogenase n=1 Tax=Undibacterium terreum TaxID=1224302 RepID=A0A916UZM2_9BURK|nr:FAD-binding oxidoreductase [Undibacterium terreum]GGC96960.1 4-cresol dehydrogenase [Undibacterium terreum]
MNSEAAMSDWARLLGASQVLDARAAELAYGADTNGITRRLHGALQILDSELLPEVMRIASRHKVPVYPISTGKNWGYGSSLPASNDCMILDLSRLTRIVHFDAELGVVTLEPGVTQGMLTDFLDQGAHPFLVPVTGAGPTVSLLGNALERGYGITPYTDHFAAVTDLEAVLPDGSLYRTAMREAGGEDLARLFKGGIGPGSSGLFTQSGFGVVTRMSIALARRPECIKACLFSLKDDSLLETAVERIRGILSRFPGIVGGINLMNQHRVLAMSAPFPHDRLDANGMIPAAVISELGKQYQIFPWTGFGTLYGSKRVVAAAQKEIRAALSGVASRLLFISPERAGTLAKVAGYIPGAGGQRLARTVNTLAKSLQLVAGRPNETALPLAYWRNPHPPGGALRNPAADGCGLIWYPPLVPMRPAGVRSYVEMVKKITQKHGIEPLITLTSISDRVFDSTVPIIFEKQKPEAQLAADNCYQDLLETGRQMGYFPYRVGIHSMQHLASLQHHARDFHGKLKNHLDPANILAPGRYS